MNLHDTGKDEAPIKEPPRIRVKVGQRINNGNYNNQTIIVQPDVWYPANWYTPKKTVLVYMPDTPWDKTIVHIKDVVALENL